MMTVYEKLQMEEAATSQTPGYDMALQFMRGYRAFEKMPLAEGHLLIRKLAPRSVDHVCDHWRWKKRQFGSFWFEMDLDFRISLMRHFGVDNPELRQEWLAYQDQSYEAQKARFFRPQHPLVKGLSDMLMFFENHGMNETAAPGIQLTKVPDGKKAFGNAGNWANYILKLPEDIQRDLIPRLINFYPEWEAAREAEKAAKEAGGA